MSIFKDKYKQLKRILCFIFIFMVCFQCIMPSEVVYAKIGGHDTYVIQPRLNADGTYTAKPVQSYVTFGKGLEQKNGLNFGEVFKNDYGQVDISEDVSEKFGDYLYFSFPSHDAYKGFDNDYNNTSGDYNRATEVSELIDELNSLIQTIDDVDGRTDITNANKTIVATKELITTSNGTYLKNPNDISNISNISNTPVTVNLGNVGTVFYCYYNSDSSWEGIYYDAFGNDETNKDIKLKVYFTSKKNASFDINDIDTYQSFYWAQLKGYLGPDGKLKNQASKASEINGQSYLDGLSSTNISPLGDSLNNENSGDNAWITIFDMATVANYYYVAEGVSTDDAANEANWFEKMIFNIVSSFALTLKAILGLDDVTELIYNNNTNTISGGTMNNTWWSIMLKYHLIFQVIAWLLVGLAVAKLLLELNFSSVQPNVRVSIFETLQKIFVVGFLLALAVPIIRLMTDVNVAFVDIFRTQAPMDDTDMFTIGNTLAQTFAYFSYIGILLMINCTYIMRSIMIAIFGASAPLFIVSMLFSKGKGMFDNWLKEMAANIFLQSVHAFAFAFLFAVIDTSALLPKLVVFWSLMPITEQFRGFIFGSSGGFTTKQGNAMGSFIQKQATANARNAASTTSAMAGKGIQNSSVGQKLGLKSAEETGNATGVGGGGTKSSRGGKPTSSNAGADVMKDMAQQKMLNSEDGKSANRWAAAGHALSAGGQIGGQAMDMMDAMTDIQMQNFEGAGRSLDNVRSAGSNMAVSAADYGSQAVKKWNDGRAEKTLKKAEKTTSGIRNLANALHGDNKEAQDFAKQGLSSESKRTAKKIAKAMNRLGVDRIDDNGTQHNGSSGNFVGGNGHNYSSIDTSSIKDGWANINDTMSEDAANTLKNEINTNGREIYTNDGTLIGKEYAGFTLSADGTKIKTDSLETTKYTNHGKSLVVDKTAQSKAVYSNITAAHRTNSNNSSDSSSGSSTSVSSASQSANKKENENKA